MTATEWTVAGDPRDPRADDSTQGPATPRVGVKHDAGKPRWALLPWKQVEDVVAVLTYGSTKYADHNWMRVPSPRDRYLSAAMRHIAAWSEGERLDRETGLPHLAHAVCCLLFLAWFDAKGWPTFTPDAGEGDGR